MTQVLAVFILVLILPYVIGFIRRSLSSNMVVDDSTPSIDRRDDVGVYSGIWYFVAGLAFLAWSTQFDNGVSVGYMSAALLAIAGYWIMVGKSFSRSDVRQARVNVLGFYAGAGVNGLWMMAFVCLIGSIVLFGYPHAITYFLGIQTAIGFGMFVNLIRRT